MAATWGTPFPTPIEKTALFWDENSITMATDENRHLNYGFHELSWVSTFAIIACMDAVKSGSIKCEMVTGLDMLVGIRHQDEISLR